MRKACSILAGAAGVGAAVGGLGAFALLRRPLPRTSGLFRLPGLTGEVEVLRDQWGVPHIYAPDLPSLLFAQGFVHAQDRLWQLDLQRRLVAGRLAEVLGAKALPVDRWVRTLTMRRVAEGEVALLAPEIRAALEAYCRGVNARISQGRLPVEFTLLRYRPEPWAVADTLSWVKMVAWTLSVNWEAELLRARLLERLGAERAAELEPGWEPAWPIVVPALARAGTSPNRLPLADSALERAESARLFLGPAALAGLGSNGMVVAGERTASGAPLLANDMHLPMNVPAIWYENHLVAGDLNATGVTFPGIPLVVAGHNGHVAWGFTNGFPDVQDLYMERLRRTADGRVQYEFLGEWLEAQVYREEIRVKGGETAVEEVVVTRHGPVLNSLAAELAGEEPMALRWTALEPDTMIQSLFAMMHAHTCLEFREALRGWTAPVQNVVYADTEGNIGYSFQGKVPIRARGQGLVPAPGWTGEYEWTGYVPFEELPHLYNPPQGYVATANNRVVGDDYPYFLGTEFSRADRARRIVEMIDARSKLDINYVMDMQFDLVSPSARSMGACLGRLDASDPELAGVAAMMGLWDGRLTADSPEAAVYEVVVRRLLILLLASKLGELAVRYMGKGPTPLLADGSMFGRRAWNWLLSLMDQQKSPWFDQGHGEGRDEVLQQALRDSVDFLKAELGPQVRDWAWGKLHTLTYRHMLGSVKPLDRLFNRGPYPLGGDDGTLWATGSNMHDLDCPGIVGPPFRFVVDLGDVRNSWGLLAPGQSGQPGSRHYGDQVQAWFAGAYHPMLYTRDDVERGTRARLVLEPATAGGV